MASKDREEGKGLLPEEAQDTQGTAGLATRPRGSMRDHPEPSCPVALTKLWEQAGRLGGDLRRTGSRRQRLLRPLGEGRQEGGQGL